MTACASSDEPKRPSPQSSMNEFYIQFTEMVPARYLTGVEAMQEVAAETCITLTARDYEQSTGAAFGSFIGMMRQISNELTGDLVNDGANSYRINDANWFRYDNGKEYFNIDVKLAMNVTSMYCRQ